MKEKSAYFVFKRTNKCKCNQIRTINKYLTTDTGPLWVQRQKENGGGEKALKNKDIFKNIKTKMDKSCIL